MDQSQRELETKYKVGDWIRYNGALYQVYDIGDSDDGPVYAIKADKSILIIGVKEGDEYFQSA